MTMEMVDLPLTGTQAELEGEFGKKAGKCRPRNVKALLLKGTYDVKSTFLTYNPFCCVLGGQKM